MRSFIHAVYPVKVVEFVLFSGMVWQYWQLLLIYLLNEPRLDNPSHQHNDTPYNRGEADLFHMGDNFPPIEEASCLCSMLRGYNRWEVRDG